MSHISIDIEEHSSTEVSISGTSSVSPVVVETNDTVAIVEISVDENSAQSAADAAAAAQLALDEFKALDVFNKLDRGGYQGTAQDLSDSIESIYQPDTVIRYTAPTRVGNTFTFPNGGYDVLLSKILKTNVSELETTIAAATDGFKRIDLVYFKSDNTISKIEGDESETVAVRPEVPAGCIELCFINVFGATIEVPEVNGAFVQKSERANVVLNGSGVINQLNLVDERASIVFKGSITRLNTISYAAVPYNGKRITLFNAQATPVTIGHSVSGYGVDFVFSDGQDYILAPNQTIEFSFDITYAPYAHHMLIGSKTDISGKVDKVAGERLINSDEITKLAGLGNVVTTVRTILSTALTTQDIPGFVTYINTLALPLVVGANEIVEYKTSDTGRVFKLLLRGRSFGVGQPAIVAADVLETTEFLNKDIRLSNYPSTRNDGQLPNNKVLGTDANGNLKLYSMAILPAPYMEILIPDSTLPSVTTDFTIKGAFFTPTMTVSIVGQTINYFTFVSDNLIKVNVTTSAAQGSYAVTLNNGLAATFYNALQIVLGTVFIPKLADWTNVSNCDVTTDGEFKINVFNVNGSARWDKPFNITKNWRFQFRFSISPLGVSAGADTSYNISFYRKSDNAFICGIVHNTNASWYSFHAKNGVLAQQNYFYSLSNTPSNKELFYNTNYYWFEYNKTNNNIAVYVNGVVVATPFANVVINSDIYVVIQAKTIDIKNLKYIELAT